MAYYNALQQLPLSTDTDTPAKVRQKAVTAFIWIIVPFALVLLAVGLLHFNDDCIRANNFGELFQFNWRRTDSVAAVILLVLLAAPFPSLFVVLTWQAWHNLTSASLPHRTYSDEIRYLRSRRFLDEEGRRYFFRRLEFALAIVLVADGLIAQLLKYPSGIFAEGKILQLVVMGAAGYYLYALIAFTQRFLRAISLSACCRLSTLASWWC